MLRAQPWSLLLAFFFFNEMFYFKIDVLAVIRGNIDPTCSLLSFPGGTAELEP